MTKRSTYPLLVSLAIVSTLASVAVVSCGNGSSGDFGDGSTGGSSGSSSGSNSGSTSSSSSSGGSNGSSSSTGGSSSGSSGSSSGSSSSGASSGTRDAGASDDHYIPTCGRPCNLRTNTCCLPADGGPDAATCLTGTTATCGVNVATLHCGGATDCASGEICCGMYTSNTADTVCQSSKCQVQQFCETNAECGNGVQCVHQLCGTASVYLCGLQSLPPYNCVAQ